MEIKPLSIGGTRVYTRKPVWYSETMTVMWALAIGWSLVGVCLVSGVGVAQGGSAVGAENAAPGPQMQERASSKTIPAKVTLFVNDSTVKFVVDAITRQANLQPVYNTSDSLWSKRISVNLEKMDAMEALAQVLKGTGLTAKIAPDGETVMIRPHAERTPGNVRSQEQTGLVTGRVTDSATGKPIPGVTVTLSGTKKTAVTNEQGNFTLLEVPLGDQSLTVRIFGYRSVTRSITVVQAKPNRIVIVLSTTPTTLSGVVTTATGMQRKIEIGNDITTINVEEVMKQAPITSVTDLLEARVPGLTVMRTSGVPGAPSRIRLRGIGGGMLSGVSGAPTNDPIVIVDGIRIHASQSGVDDQRLGGGTYATPSPIDQIDPNSIETIQVLKGPSASAMYGSDAADGVIVITTKLGRAGAARWNISGSSGVQAMPGFYAKPGYYRFCSEIAGSFNATFKWSCPYLGDARYFSARVDSVVRFQALNEPRLSTIARGYDNTISATASGGSQSLTYSVTGSASQSLGLTKMPPLYQDIFKQLYDSLPSKRMRRPDTYNSKSGNATFKGDLAKGLNATFSTSLSHGTQHQSSANQQLSTLASLYIDTANLNPAVVGDYAYQLDVGILTSINALALNMNRWAFLPMTATFGLNGTERSAEGLAPRGILTSLTGDVYTNPSTYTTVGSFRERREHSTTATTRLVGTLWPQARISTVIGAERTRQSDAAMDGYSDTLVPGVSRPSTIIGGTRSGRNNTTGGWFLEPRLNVNSRFFVNPGFRFDGSGVSGARSGFRGGLLALFPKMNFSWVALDREGGEPLWGLVSLFRPRLAFGIAGVQPAVEWSLRTLEQNTGTWSPVIAALSDSVAPNMGLRLRSVGNTQLGPEKTREVEGGFDMQLWDTRFTLSITQYYKMRVDAIQQLPLPPSVGTRLGYYANIGHVLNTGTELTLNAVILDLPAIGWNVDVSLSRNTNKLTKLYAGQIDLGNGTRLVEGYPLFGRWSRPILGWTEPSDGLNLRNADIIVADSAVYMGLQTPDFEMPISTGLTLMRGLFSLNALFNYKAGMTQYNLGGQALLSNIYESPESSRAQQAAALAAACFNKTSESGNRGMQCTDFGFIQKVNSLRFNSISIGYNLPRSYLTSWPFSSVSFALQGSNIGLWSNYRGKDPDVNGNLIGDVTQDTGQLPMPRTWRLQIRLGT